MTSRQAVSRVKVQILRDGFDSRLEATAFDNVSIAVDQRVKTHFKVSFIAGLNFQFKGVKLTSKLFVISSTL